MERLKDRVAVVTGSASGMGLGMAGRFLDEGMKVVLADIEQDALDRAVAGLKSRGEVIGKRTDVSNPADVDALAETAVKQFGAVHLLVNNAGVGGFQKFETTGLDMWNWVMGVNIMGVVHGCRSFLPILAAQDEAHIVSTGSISSILYAPYLHPYSVSKAGVMALMEGLYLEFEVEHPHIGVSVLCPGSTATNIGNDERNAPANVVRRGDADPGTESIREAVIAANMAGKTPDEVADYVVRGIRERRLHIWTDPQWFAPLRTRVDAMCDGRKFANPFVAVQ